MFGYRCYEPGDGKLYAGREHALHGAPWCRSLAHAGLYDCPGGRIETYSSQSDRMATARAGRRTLPHGRLPDVLPPDGDGPFYEYYQIGRADEPDEAETEPKKEGELRTEYEPSHSPFGFIWQVASATGWSVEYILKRVNYQTLIMMLSDAPRYVRRRGEETPDKSGSTIDRLKTVNKEAAREEAENIVSFFQSNLEA